MVKVGDKVRLTKLTYGDKSLGYNTRDTYTVNDVFQGFDGNYLIYLKEKPLGRTAGFFVASSYILVDETKTLKGENTMNRTLLETYPTIGSRWDTLFVFQEDHNLILKTGCFEGNLTEFKKQVAEKPAGNTHRKDYEAVIRSLELKYPDFTKEELFYVKFSNELIEQIGDDTSCYLNVWSSESSRHSFDTKKVLRHTKTQFTSKEADEWIKRLDKLDLVKIPAQ